MATPLSACFIMLFGTVPFPCIAVVSAIISLCLCIITLLLLLLGQARLCRRTSARQVFLLGRGDKVSW
jgi:hypothetical protein